MCAVSPSLIRHGLVSVERVVSISWASCFCVDILWIYIIGLLGLPIFFRDQPPPATEAESHIPCVEREVNAGILCLLHVPGCLWLNYGTDIMINVHCIRVTNAVGDAQGCSSWFISVHVVRIIIYALTIYEQGRVSCRCVFNIGCMTYLTACMFHRSVCSVISTRKHIIFDQICRWPDGHARPGAMGHCAYWWNTGSQLRHEISFVHPA